jgi:serine protease Do
MRFKKIFWFFFLLTLILPTGFAKADSGFLGIINSFFPQKESALEISLTQNELTNLVRPSIVRIVQKTTGSISMVKNFDVSLKDFKITPLPDLEKPEVIPVGDDLIYTGTGFIISSDGYIMTNSHVISTEAFLDNFTRVLTETVFKGAVNEMTDAEIKAFDEKIKTKEGEKQLETFLNDIKKEFLKSFVYNLETEIVVANPDSNKDNLDLEKLMSEGFKAKIISINNNTLEDQKDVAVIKIEETNLPTLSFADTEKIKVSVGQKLYSFGFPASADFSSKLDANFFEPTLSSGAVSSFKDSVNADFKVIQVDMKTSSGSSGSPILNEKGEVVGILTYASAKQKEISGDSFSFAVPVSVIEEVLENDSIFSTYGNLQENFIKGLSSISKNQHRKAKEEFTAAKDFNTIFGSNSFIDEYISKSEKAILDGKSIDGEWQLLLDNIKPYYSMIVIVIVSMFLVLLLVSLLFLLLKKLKKDEEKIEELTKNDQKQNLILNKNYEQPSIDALNVMPQSNSYRINDIIQFIKKSVAAGQTDGLIFRGLKGGGYTDQEIQEAFIIFKKIK